MTKLDETVTKKRKEESQNYSIHQKGEIFKIKDVYENIG